MLTNSDLFNETFYTNTNPDVAAAIANGFFRNGLEHFLQFGQFEKRNPGAFFDTAYYLQQNSDVANVVNANITTAFAHFINAGQNEGRNPFSLFSNSFYLTNNADVNAAVSRDEITGIQHYIQYGAEEGRNPSRFFDNSFYLQRNSDVAQAVQTDIITGVEHYIQYGQFEGRIPRLLFSQMFVFGDSLSDDGNIFALTQGAVPPSPPYFNGRFSNGPVWVEYLAPTLGLTQNPANNFALGGATTGTENSGNITGLPPLPGLQQQIDGFTAANLTADPNALYVVYAGANDYLGLGITDVTTVVNNLTTAVTKLAAVGARNFMIPNLPNLGLLPGPASQGPQFQQGLTLISTAHDTNLTASLAALEQNPNINVIPVDVFSLFNNAIANPAAFGFTNVTNNVVPGAGADPTVAGFTIPDGVNPNQYLFWDLIHPTTLAHSLVSNTALKATTAIGEVVEIL
ncbi:SGNH/GDSL hydrolase family protein [Aerosakkonemataceae cyanobacterium BLCC-F154]|uniref:SGNH/GDSL hydrolase family protein n=1 Tax=Floridaenema fluviatile BLCC-F154 TaxID=3153640 RepID=A0ABV4Y7M4_9CYAN